ncbi:MAG: hypothetical protein M5R36_24545 [Deltaproteobacteria bacterium]|nr:hypothetical protein [Deltaproteobacteria bacterium]
MKKLNYAVGAYAIVNFIVFMAIKISLGMPESNDAAWSALDIRGFSGHAMYFYCGAMAIMHSAGNAPAHDAARKCPSGHHVSPISKFCEECGQHVGDSSETTR